MLQVKFWLIFKVKSLHIGNLGEHNIRRLDTQETSIWRHKYLKIIIILTWIKATSGLIIFRWNSNGISERKIGTQSERPSATALRTFAAIKKEHDLKIPAKINIYLMTFQNSSHLQDWWIPFCIANNWKLVNNYHIYEHIRCNLLRSSSLKIGVWPIYISSANFCKGVAYAPFHSLKQSLL